MYGRAIAMKSAAPDSSTAHIVSVRRIPPTAMTVVLTLARSARAQGKK